MRIISKHIIRKYNMSYFKKYIPNYDTSCYNRPTNACYYVVNMKIVIAFGRMHEIYKHYINKKLEVINDKSLMLGDLPNYLSGLPCRAESIVITDGAFSGTIEKDTSSYHNLLEWLLSNSPATIVIILTNDHARYSALKKITDNRIKVDFIFCNFIRLPFLLVQGSCEKNTANRQEINYPVPATEDKEPKRKVLNLSIFRSREGIKKPEPTESLTREFNNIGKSISRIIAITGHRGSGVSSTVHNIANVASKRGLNTAVIDLDIVYRSSNMYYSRFHEWSQKDETINASLIRTLANPQDYQSTAFNVKNSLWLLSLGYAFTDKKLIEQFYNSAKLITLITVLRNKFNLLILDMPLDIMRSFQECMIYIDVFGLCVSNNIYSIVNTLRNIEWAFDKDTIALLNSKSSLVVTKQNSKARFHGDFFTPEKVNEILTSGLCRYFTYDMKIAGYVPYISDFDIQIESDMPISNTNKEMEEAYSKILIRLIGG